MKVYISVDIEGVTGVVSWDQTGPDRNNYTYARKQMTAEAVAACQGAIDAGAGQILLKDAHNNARNIEPDAVPACVRLSRGWSGHPLFMMDDIDGSYDAAVLIGYHSRAGSGGSPLAHTMSSSRVATISINGQTVSEAIINTMAAASLNVPTVFVSGDELLCQDVRSYNHAVTTVATQRGKGDSVICIQPATAVILIQQGVAKALKGNLADCLTPLPPSLELVIEFRDAKVAYARSFYPGARLLDDRRVEFKTGECFEMLRAIAFMVL
jgi:D-amino peptidase